MPEPDLSWKEGRSIPGWEFVFESDTSGGPGGQHANRSQTRVTLLWSPGDSSAFSPEEKERLASALGSRMNAEGVVRIRSAGERSARRNKEECREILAQLIREALRPRRKRRPTKPTRGSVERRLQEKQRRSQIKARRQRPPKPDE